MFICHSAVFDGLAPSCVEIIICRLVYSAIFLQALSLIKVIVNFYSSYQCFVYNFALWLAVLAALHSGHCNCSTCSSWSKLSSYVPLWKLPLWGICTSMGQTYSSISSCLFRLSVPKLPNDNLLGYKEKKTVNFVVKQEFTVVFDIRICFNLPLLWPWLWAQCNLDFPGTPASASAPPNQSEDGSGSQGDVSTASYLVGC